jgi:hypothetical protein
MIVVIGSLLGGSLLFGSQTLKDDVMCLDTPFTPNRSSFFKRMISECAIAGGEGEVSFADEVSGVGWEGADVMLAQTKTLSWNRGKYISMIAKLLSAKSDALCVLMVPTGGDILPIRKKIHEQLGPDVNTMVVVVSLAPELPNKTSYRFLFVYNSGYKHGFSQTALSRLAELHPKQGQPLSSFIDPSGGGEILFDRFYIEWDYVLRERGKYAKHFATLGPRVLDLGHDRLRPLNQDYYRRIAVDLLEVPDESGRTADTKLRKLTPTELALLCGHTVCDALKDILYSTSDYAAVTDLLSDASPVVWRRAFSVFIDAVARKCDLGGLFSNEYLDELEGGLR